jgi:bile acid:Na+ symporter, BASS family
MPFLGAHINIILNVVLALIMFGLGLSLKRNDFDQLIKQPKLVAIGLFAQMLLLPLIVAILVSFLPISPAFKVGILILSICPGGVTSNLVSYFAKGNVALSVSLTVSNAIITLFTIPILVNVFLDLFFNTSQTVIELPFLDTVFSIFLVTILPASLGMTVRNYLGKKILKIQKTINILFPILLLLVFAIKFFGGKSSGGTEISREEILFLTPMVISLNVLAFAIGYLVAWIFRLSFRNAITIAIEIGLHNTALALIIAGEILQNTEMEKPALVYALYSFFITLFISITAVKWRLHILKSRKTSA